MLFGTGKAEALKAAKTLLFRCLGNMNANFEDVILECKKFAAKCYGQKDIISSKNRRSIWVSTTDGAKLSAKPSALKRLPPTDKALLRSTLNEHIMRLSCGKIICRDILPISIHPSQHFNVGSTLFQRCESTLK